MFGDYTFVNNIDKKIIREITEALKNKKNWESWSLAFYGNDYLNVEYNFAIDNSTEETVISSAFYRLVCGINGHVSNDDCSVYYPYIIDFADAQWKEKFEEAAKQAFKELFDTVKTKQTVYGETMTDAEFDKYVIAECKRQWEENQGEVYGEWKEQNWGVKNKYYHELYYHLLAD